MIKFVERNMPLGIEYGRELTLISLGFIASAIYSMGFFLRLTNEISGLYYYSSEERKLYDGIMMPDFYQVLGEAMVVFAVLAIAMVGLAVYHYMYHYDGSKSIYLMRRLPARWELERRCLTVPIASVFVCILLSLVLTFLYLGVYMLAVPKQCLAPDQLEKLMSALTGGLL